MLFPSAPFPGWLVAVPLVMAPLALVAGSLYFARAERDFADVI
jgi:hypothetical protein